MPWPCFWLEPTDTVRRYLRRYAGGLACPGPMGYHDARVRIEDEVVVWGGDAEHRYVDNDTTPPASDDPRWPVKCDSCDYVFVESDNRQLFVSLVYRRQDIGAEIMLADAPPGAMWNADWWPEKKADGLWVVARCPGGCDWTIDGPSSNGDGWSRTGVPPKISVTPSILTPNYHGHLTDGMFTDDLEGRTY